MDFSPTYGGRFAVNVVVGGVLDAPRRCPANVCLPEGSKNRDTGPCGPVSLLLMRFYAFLKPTLCMNLTKAA